MDDDDDDNDGDDATRGSGGAPPPPSRDAPWVHPSGVRFCGSVFMAHRPGEDGGVLAVRRSGAFGSHAVHVFASADDVASDLARLRLQTRASLLAARACAALGIRRARERALSAAADLLAQLVPERAPTAQAAASEVRHEFRPAAREAAAARRLLLRRAARDDDGAWDAAATAERIAAGGCPVWAAPGFVTQTHALEPLARPWFFSRRALRRFVDAAVDATAATRRVQRRGMRSATLAGRKLAFDVAFARYNALSTALRRPQAAPPPSAEDERGSDDDDDDGDGERDRMIAEASREFGGTPPRASSSSAMSSMAAHAQQLEMLEAASHAALSAGTQCLQCWFAGLFEEVTDAVALRTLRGRRVLATGSPADPARLEALSIAELGEMLARRPDDERWARRGGLGGAFDADPALQWLRLLFGAGLKAHGGGDDDEAGGHAKSDAALAVSYDQAAARQYLDGGWLDGPARYVQPLIVGHLEPEELHALAHNAQICRRLPSAKRRADRITGT
jgi:hypothetical protein